MVRRVGVCMLQWTGSCFRAWHWWEKAAKSPSLELRGAAIVQGRTRLARNSAHFIPRTLEHINKRSGPIGMLSQQETVGSLLWPIETWRGPARIVRFHDLNSIDRFLFAAPAFIWSR